jgi:hypothetical protein
MQQRSRPHYTPESSDPVRPPRSHPVAAFGWDHHHQESNMELIGAGVVVAGVVLLAVMWLSKMGGDVVSDRDPSHSRDRLERFDPTLQRSF